METLEKKLEDAIWVAKSLFDRGKTSGSSANLSFEHEGKIYITVSGSSFGKLQRTDFVCIDKNGNPLSEGKASKEYPLHCLIYQKSQNIKAVIHIHSTYAVLWSCMMDDSQLKLPQYTPYLDIKIGPVHGVGYAPPGSQDLFRLFESAVGKGKGYILANHGPIVGGSSIMDAFFGIEELEEHCKVAWLLRDEKSAKQICDYPFSSSR